MTFIDMSYSRGSSTLKWKRANKRKREENLSIQHDQGPQYETEMQVLKIKAQTSLDTNNNFRSFLLVSLFILLVHMFTF
jgi:hypothetical protein